MYFAAIIVYLVLSGGGLLLHVHVGHYCPLQHLVTFCSNLLTQFTPQEVISKSDAIALKRQESASSDVTRLFYVSGFGYEQATRPLFLESAKSNAIVMRCKNMAGINLLLGQFKVQVGIRKELLRGLSPLANYSDRAAAAGRRS